MEKILNSLKKYSPMILRVGMAIVAIWFGTQELLNPGVWTGYIPESIVNITNMNANLLVNLNGAFEVIFGLALFFGIKTRITAMLLMIHMFDITYIVGYNALGIRDLGLAFGLLSVFMYGPSLISFDIFKEKTTNSVVV